MGKSAAAAPTPPDPAKTIAAQSAANKEAIVESAKVNSVDITGPFGKTYYRRNADGTPAEQITELDPRSKQIYDTGLGISGELANTAANRIQGIPQDKFSLAGMPYDPRNVDSSTMPAFSAGGVTQYDPQSYGDMNTFSSTVGDSIYNEGAKRLEDKFTKDRRTLEQTLANRGLPMTGEAYRTAMEDQARSENDAYSSLSNQAIQSSLAHTQGIVGLEQGLRGTAWNENLQGHQQGQADYLQKLQVEANLRGQSVNDMLMERNQDINETSMLLGAGPQMGMPGAPNVPTYQVAAPNVQGAYDNNFNQQMASYNAGRQQNAGMWSGISSIGSAAMPFLFGSHPGFKEVIGDA